MRQKDVDIWTIEDLGSFNGTFIANDETNQYQQLQTGFEYVLWV